MKRVICDSGIEGFECRLRENYEDFDCFRHYSDMFGLAERLGFRYAWQAWEANPTIQGSVVPSDFRAP